MLNGPVDERLRITLDPRLEGASKTILTIFECCSVDMGSSLNTSCSVLNRWSTLARIFRMLLSKRLAWLQYV